MEFIKTVEIDYKHLRACALFKAHMDVRFYLCGVAIRNGQMCATNGHVLLVCDEPETVGIDVIIPSETIKSILGKLGTKFKGKINLHQIDDEFWMLSWGNLYELFKPVDGKYPAIEKVDLKKPESTKIEYFPVFDFDYLIKFKKAMEIVTGFKVGSPRLYPTSTNGACYVEIDEFVHGVIMPMKS